jgi:hypothetical protein
MVNDVAKLIYNFPLNKDNIQQIPNETIQLIYNINGFKNYKEFLYPVSNNVEVLHSMLNYEPEASSRIFFFHYSRYH